MPSEVLLILCFVGGEEGLAMPASKRSITVVGGGLAGMVAALRLLERGCDVNLYEADIRLGGKAGANASGSGHEDHGYHIFPMWYVNVWKLVEEMDIDSHFVDRTDFIQLKPHEFQIGRASCRERV